MSTCPCCGQELTTSVGIDALARSLRLTPFEREMFVFLARRVGRAVPTESLHDYLYSNNPNGGPDDAYSCSRAVASRLRRKLKPFGYTITRQHSGRAVGMGTTSLERLSA